MQPLQTTPPENEPFFGFRKDDSTCEVCGKKQCKLTPVQYGDEFLSVCEFCKVECCDSCGVGNTPLMELRSEQLCKECFDSSISENPNV